MQIRLLSYNIHQGRTARRTDGAWARLKEHLLELAPDVVVLQEVAGSDDPEELEEGTEVRVEQLEQLAEGAWPHKAFGKNSIFKGGFHGNAVLSRIPIETFEHVDLSVSVPRTKNTRRFSTRSLLHVQLKPEALPRVHLVATHFGLLEFERTSQREALCAHLNGRLEDSEPLLVAGDFNDWRQKLSHRLQRELSLEEVFLSAESRHAKTFPAKFPVLCLDRIYFRGVSLESVRRPRGEPWGTFSDHLPLVADFRLEVPGEKK